MLDEIQAKVSEQQLFEQQKQAKISKTKAPAKADVDDKSEMSAAGLGTSTQRNNDRNIQKMKDMQRLKKGTIRKQVKRIEK